MKPAQSRLPEKVRLPEPALRLPWASPEASFSGALGAPPEGFGGRRTALHDVVDLLGIDGFPFEQGLRHHLDLVAMLFQQLARQRVLLVDDAADFRIDLSAWSPSDMFLCDVTERPRKTS